MRLGKRAFPQALMVPCLTTRGIGPLIDWPISTCNMQHIFNAQWQIMARLFYDRYYYTGDYLYDYPPLTLNKDIAQGELVGWRVPGDHPGAAEADGNAWCRVPP